MNRPNFKSRVVHLISGKFKINEQEFLYWWNSHLNINHSYREFKKLSPNKLYKS